MNLKNWKDQHVLTSQKRILKMKRKARIKRKMESNKFINNK
jgi:hypothetical protein